MFAVVETKEHNVSAKLSFLLEKTAAKTVAMLQTAYKDATMNKPQVYKLLPRFRTGTLSFENESHSGRLSTFHTNTNIIKIHKLVLDDCQLANLLIEVVCSGVSANEILSVESGKKRVVAKLRPHLLTEDKHD